jgi:hypothetical protein
VSVTEVILNNLNWWKLRGIAGDYKMRKIAHKINRSGLESRDFRSKITPGSGGHRRVAPRNTRIPVAIDRQAKPSKELMDE